MVIPGERPRSPTPREQYTASFKLRVISFAEAHGNRCAGRKYSVSERNIRRWRIMKNRLKSCSANRQSFRGPKTGKLPFIETELAAYVRENRRKGKKVTWNMIATKARVLATACGVSQDRFRASRGWMTRFMSRHRLSSSRSLPTERYCSVYGGVCDTKSFALSNIAVVCHMVIYFDEPHEFVVADDFAEFVESNVVNVVLSCTADGQKLPPYIAFKQEIEDESLFRSNIQVCSIENDDDVLLDWVQNVWLCRPGSLVHQKSLIVLDTLSLNDDPRVDRLLTDRLSRLCSVSGLFSDIADSVLQRVMSDYSDWMVSEGLWHVKRRAKLNYIADWIALAWLAVSRSEVKQIFRSFNVDLHCRVDDSGSSCDEGCGIEVGYLSDHIDYDCGDHSKSEDENEKDDSTTKVIIALGSAVQDDADCVQCKTSA